MRKVIAMSQVGQLFLIGDKLSVARIILYVFSLKFIFEYTCDWKKKQGWMVIFFIINFIPIF